ncbi:hypothetical protein D3C75_1276100 [compost metagenome]
MAFRVVFPHDLIGAIDVPIQLLDFQVCIVIPIVDRQGDRFTSTLDSIDQV